MRTVHLWRPTPSTIGLFALSFFAGGPVHAQPSCSVALELKAPKAGNIFSLRQEQILGDIEAEWVESNYGLANDERLRVHLNAVAGRILSQFPRDQARVRIILIDTPAAGSFSTGPERIYITRKMVALLRNDDELAGLLGHELGHIFGHDNAIVVSQLFHEILGVSAVSNRKDISEKLKRMLDSIDRDTRLLRKAAQIIERHEATHQYEADRVGLYALAASGFSPKAYVELFDRSAETNGRTGNPLGNFFGVTTSDEKRLREINKTLRRFPQSCRETDPVASAEFQAWQAAVLSYPDTAQR